MDPQRYGDLLEMVLERGPIKIVKDEGGNAGSLTDDANGKDSSEDTNNFSQSESPEQGTAQPSDSKGEVKKKRTADDYADSRRNSQISLLSELGIPFFTIEDTERGFGITFTQKEKTALHIARNRIADELIRSMLNNGLGLRYYTEKKAYVVVYPKDINVIHLTKRFPKLLSYENILNEVPSFLKEDFAFTASRPGVGLHFGLGSFPGMTYEDQWDHLHIYRDETGISFRASKVIEEICALLTRMTKIKHYPDSYGCIFRTLETVNYPDEGTLSGQIAVSARLDRKIGVDICLNNPGYRGISCQHSYYIE